MKISNLCAFAFAVLAIAACNQPVNPDPEPAGTDIFDVNLSFSHPKVSPQEGQKLTVNLYESAVRGVQFTSLTAYESQTVTLTAAQASSGLRVAFDGLKKKGSSLYVFAWVDIDADGKPSDGDLAQWYNTSKEDVEKGDADATDCFSSYAITFKLSRVIGGGGKVEIPEGYVADADQNLYSTVVAGPFVWTGENLRTTHFQDGSEITLLSGADFAAQTAPACVKGYLSATDIEKFGLLYNWYTVGTAGKNPCPEGYRIPSDADWLKFERFVAPRATDLGEDASDAPEKNVWRGASELLGKMMKPAEYNMAGTDDYGLKLYPGGVYASALSKDAYTDTPIFVIWTTDSFAGNDSKAVRRMLQYNQNGSGRGCDSKVKGQSLRCIKDNPDYKEKTGLAAPELTVNGTVVSWTAVSGASEYVVAVNGEEVSRSGATSFDVASVKPAQEEDKSYEVSVYATGNPELYTDSPVATAQVTVPGTGSATQKEYVSDFDGNKYEIVTIGTQTWMREHLRTTHFQDGTPIQNLTGSAFAGATEAAYVNPYSDGKELKYGYLYNWFTVGTAGKNPCPAGYHAPSDDEFLVLERYLIDDPSLDQDKTQADYGNNSWRGTDKELGKKMKSSDDNFGGDDDSAFKAMAAGTYSSSLTKDFSASTKICVLWTTDTYAGNEAKAMRRMLQHNTAGSGRGSATKVSGHSIRCVKD